MASRISRILRELVCAVASTTTPPIRPVRSRGASRPSRERVWRVTPQRYDKPLQSTRGSGRRGWHDPGVLTFHGDAELAEGLVDLAVNVRPDPLPDWLAG